MFSVDIGFVTFLIALFTWQIKPNFSWISEKKNMQIVKVLTVVGFLCSVYLILAGLNLFALDYSNEFAKPFLEHVSSNPEVVKGVHSPKRGIAVLFFLVLPWGLVFIGVATSCIYLANWKKYF